MALAESEGLTIKERAFSVAEAQEVVARAHLAVAAALRHGEAEAVPDMRHALREIGRDDDEVVEGEHRAGSA